MSVNLLPFLRGLDLSDQELSNGFPDNLKYMSGLNWVKASNSNLYEVPKQIESLDKIETLILSNNNISNLPKWICEKQNIRNIILKKNKLKCSSFTPDMFLLKDLCVLDMNNNDIERLPAEIIQAQQLQVLNLSSNNIYKLPSQLFTNLNDLLYLDLSENNLESLPPQFRKLTKLQTLILNDNPLSNFYLKQLPRLISLKTLKLRNTGRTVDNIPLNIESLSRLEDLDLSNNNLSWIPDQLFKLPNLKRLNLSENNLTIIPSKIECLDKLEVLNLCSNSIQIIPSTIANLCHLRRLYLDNNHLTVDGLPSSLGRLAHLQVLSMADNLLTSVPENLSNCLKLKTLNLASNKLQTIPPKILMMKELKNIDTRMNGDYRLPSKKDLELVKYNEEFKKFDALKYRNGTTTDTSKTGGRVNVLSNEYYNINFDLQYHLRKAGLLNETSSGQQSPNVGRDAKFQQLLQRRSNGTGQQTLNSVKVESETERKDLKGMSDLGRLVVSEKRKHIRTGSSEANLLHIAGDRDIDLNHSKASRELYSATPGSISTTTNASSLPRHDAFMSPSKPHTESEVDKVNSNLDYSDFFDPNVGTKPGVTCWEIDNFLPNILDEAIIGKFYDADCYIVLKTFYGQGRENSSLNWKIFYWIGKNATLDKQACAAIHAVNLRNFLNCTCRTGREEQGDESPEFMEVFAYNIIYIEGGRTSTGFYSVVPKSQITRLYKCTCQGNSIDVEPVPLSLESLKSDNTYLLDASKTLYVWQGSKCSSTVSSKARLLAEKVNNVERKKDCTLVIVKETREPDTFKELFKDPIIITHDNSKKQIVMPTSNASGEDNIKLKDEALQLSPKHRKFILYKVGLGAGYLELTQVRVPFKGANLIKSLLDSKSVYILDAYGCDLFVWVGKKANRLVRTAAFRLAKEVVFDFLPRPPYGEIIHLFEGTESQMFKCKFKGWNDVLAVDHTRSAQSISLKGFNVEKGIGNEGVGRKMENEIDLTALLTPKGPIPDIECVKDNMDEWNNSLDTMDCYVLEGKNYVKLPKDEIGQFYSGTCYAFMCKYWVSSQIQNPAVIAIKAAKNLTAISVSDLDESQSIDEPSVDSGNSNLISQDSNVSTTNGIDSLFEDILQTVVYFWQGRDANAIGWLIFNFSLGQKMRDIHRHDDKLQVVRLLQQQESPIFRSHFRRRFIIHHGPRPLTTKKEMVNIRAGSESEVLIANEIKNFVCILYQLRTNNGIIFNTRCIQLAHCDASQLNSAFCYIVKINDEKNGNVSSEAVCYVWMGSKSSLDERELVEDIAYRICLDFPIEVVEEGQEPENFWTLIGGKKQYDKDVEFMNHIRLFRCSNEKGYFCVMERYDFCQDDLCDDDIMILDDGIKVFIWIGPQSSEIEMKLAMKSAELYLQHQDNVCPKNPRTLSLTSKGYEPAQFKRCFHAWHPHKTKLN